MFLKADLCLLISLYRSFQSWFLFTACLLEHESHFTVSCLTHFDSLVDILGYMLLDSRFCFLPLKSVNFVVVGITFAGLKLFVFPKMGSSWILCSIILAFHMLLPESPLHMQKLKVGQVFEWSLYADFGAPVSVALSFLKILSIISSQSGNLKLYLLTPQASKTILHCEEWKVPSGGKVLNCSQREILLFQDSDYLQFLPALYWRSPWV